MCCSNQDSSLRSISYPSDPMRRLFTALRREFILFKKKMLVLALSTMYALIHRCQKYWQMPIIAPINTHHCFIASHINWSIIKWSIQTNNFTTVDQ